MRWIVLLAVCWFSTAEVAAEEFAWQARDRYVAPDFEGFFLDDAAGGQLLDEQIASGFKNENPRELLETVRRGLRHSGARREWVLEAVGKEFIWRMQSDDAPQDPYAIELMYHAAGSPEFRDDAHYYGLQVVRGKTDNILRALLDYGYDKVDRSIWGIKNYDDPNEVAVRLKALLDRPDELSDVARLAGYAIYRGLTGKAPGEAEEYKDVGSFVVVFEQKDVGIDDTRSLEEWEASFADDFGLGEELFDFTRRVSRGKVHQVALIRGIPTHDRLVAELASRPGCSLVFSHLHTADGRARLPEFHHHLAGGEPTAGPSWAHQVAAAKAVYAWNRVDKYEPPDYEGFFPDDVAAGKKLDTLIAAGDKAVGSDQETLETARRGWRRTTAPPQPLLSWLSSRFTRWPEHPYAVEICYHTLAAPAGESLRSSSAVYSCFVNLREKPDNVLRALSELYLNTSPMDSSRYDILRSFASDREKKRLAELFIEALEGFETAPAQRIVAACEGYHELTGHDPPNAAKLGGVGRFVVVFRREGIQTPEEMVKRFAEEHAKEAIVLETIARVERGEVSAIVLVDGIAERDRLLEVLSRDERYSIDAAVPLTAELTKGKDGVPEFRQYLESNESPAGDD